MNLIGLHGNVPRRTLGGYFDYSRYICRPCEFNGAIADNVYLVAGDPLIELQANAIATLANTQIPGTNAWVEIIDWISDLVGLCEADFDVVFLDTNPSFSIYTQMALSASDRLVVPVMADDSSRRAIQNVFSLVYGLQLPSPIYSQHAFATKLTQAERELPKVHLLARNRITQYMGEASAYAAVLRSIDDIISRLLEENPNLFTFERLEDGIVSIRDFQTTGVVAFAEGLPFSKLNSGSHDIVGRVIEVRNDYITHCRGAVSQLVNRL